MKILGLTSYVCGCVTSCAVSRSEVWSGDFISLLPIFLLLAIRSAPLVSCSLLGILRVRAPNQFFAVSFLLLLEHTVRHAKSGLWFLVFWIRVPFADFSPLPNLLSISVAVKVCSSRSRAKADSRR
jgi:hypothetical protein